MPLTDQQLRQELIQLGETVPPITQRNREQLRARLEALQTRSRSPPRTLTTRTRSTTSPSRAAARSRPGRRLIELSDSETDTSPSRSPSRGAKPTTRSIAVGRDTHTSPRATSDVEESIARHRREIQQLINSARDRTRAAHANISSSNYEPSPITTPLRPTATSTSIRSRQPPRSELAKPKEPSWFNRTGKRIQSFWKVNRDVILNVLKMAFIGILLGGGLIVLKKKAHEIIPHSRGITCTPQNATQCDEMIPVYDAVKQYLEIRTGEVECGMRKKSERYVPEREINQYLDKKGFKFENGPEERWKTLVAYILGREGDHELSIWSSDNAPTGDYNNAAKLSSEEGKYSLTCRLQKSAQSIMRNLAWLSLGTSGFLALGWLWKRRHNQFEEREKTYKDLTQKIIDLLEEQYDEHLRNPETDPWVAINHIRDMLIPTHERQKLKELWERAKKQISERESRVRAESQLIHGEEHDVWRWIQPRSSSSPSSPRKKRPESPHGTNEDSYVYMPPDVGLTQCLKLRNFFDSDTMVDDDEIDLVIDSIRNRCATVHRIEHIGIYSVYVYLKFSSKEAASKGFHLLNNWKYHGREIIAKYLRLERYHEHFPEAISSNN
ncbi:unnamed protein product [Adineta ricciae]|uniref:LEM domain-containing protein n=1 Tax=Adineta ricciae TaxID=249248 RepID=A0A813X3I0_ADIRI|nr:unnamed protein product [Adineta ricciae]CAF1320381.1 unnamed protein product [Adineta ricciae]